MGKYILLRVEDAHALADRIINGEPRANAKALALNILSDTGGDLREIADSLKDQEICGACAHENMERYCRSLGAQKTGRRLLRLIERADARMVPASPSPDGAGR